MMSKVKPGITPTERQKLIDAGLIRLEKRGRASHIVLEDKAWDWLAVRLQSPDFTVEFPSRATTAIPTFQVFLGKVGEFLRSHNISLAELLNPSPEPQVLSPEQHVRRAYAELSETSPGFAVPLAKLHQKLSAMPVERVNDVLLTLQGRGAVTLMPMEDPEEINPEDEAAAIDMGDGDKRYFVHIKS